jgi:hypothetical protein
MLSEKCIKISEIFFIGLERLGNLGFVFNACAMQMSCDNALPIGLGTEVCRREGFGVTILGSDSSSAGVLILTGGLNCSYTAKKSKLDPQKGLSWRMNGSLTALWLCKKKNNIGSKNG